MAPEGSPPAVAPPASASTSGNAGASPFVQVSAQQRQQYEHQRHQQRQPAVAAPAARRWAAVNLRPQASLTNDSPFAQLPAFSDESDDEQEEQDSAGSRPSAAAAPVPGPGASSCRGSSIRGNRPAAQHAADAGAGTERALPAGLQLCSLATSSTEGSLEDPFQARPHCLLLLALLPCCQLPRQSGTQCHKGQFLFGCCCSSSCCHAAAAAAPSAVCRMHIT